MPLRMEPLSRRIERLITITGALLVIVLLLGSTYRGLVWARGPAGEILLGPEGWRLKVLGRPLDLGRYEQTYWGASAIFALLALAGLASTLATLVLELLGKSRFYGMLTAYAAYTSIMVLARNAYEISRSIRELRIVKGLEIRGPVADYALQGPSYLWDAGLLLYPALAVAGLVFSVKAYNWLVEELSRFPCRVATLPIVAVIVAILLSASSLGGVRIVTPSTSLPVPSVSVMRPEGGDYLIVSVNNIVGGHIGWAQARLYLEDKVYILPVNVDLSRGNGSITVFFPRLADSMPGWGNLSVSALVEAHIYYGWGAVGYLRIKVPLAHTRALTLGISEIVLNITVDSANGSLRITGSPSQGCTAVENISISYPHVGHATFNIVGFSDSCEAVVPYLGRYLIQVDYNVGGRKGTYTDTLYGGKVLRIRTNR